jgi:hypothetical protein
VEGGRQQEGKGSSGGVSREAVAGQVRTEVPKPWFWGVFLLAMVFLWVERKMGGMNG